MTARQRRRYGCMTDVVAFYFNLHLRTERVLRRVPGGCQCSECQPKSREAARTGAER